MRGQSYLHNSSGDKSCLFSRDFHARDAIIRPQTCSTVDNRMIFLTETVIYLLLLNHLADFVHLSDTIINDSLTVILTDRFVVSLNFWEVDDSFVESTDQAVGFPRSKRQEEAGDRGGSGVDQ